MTATYSAARISAWNQTAQNAAMDNIERTINTLPPHRRGPTLRRLRVVRDTSTDEDKTGDSSAAPSRASTPCNVIPLTSPSQQSLESQYFDTRTYNFNTPEVSSSKPAPSITAVNSLPPHLRRSSAATGKAPVQNAQLSQQSQADTRKENRQAFASNSRAQAQTTAWEKISQQDRAAAVAAAQNVAQQRVQTQRPMNSGVARKSAKHDAKFPCSYADCADGFADKYTLDRHKWEEHEGWCKVCDVDHEDEEALKEHKIHSIKHICCEFCGKDFRSEGARNTHEYRDHGPKSHVRCIACGMKFLNGASLIKHIICNECRDPKDIAIEEVIRKNRRECAMSYAAARHEYELKKGSYRYDADEEEENETRSQADESKAGGIAVSLMDLPNDEDQSDDRASDTGTAGSLETVGPNQQNKDDETLSKDFDYLTMDGDEDKSFQETWAKRLFSDSKSTPTSEGWTPPRRQTERRAGGVDPRTMTSGSHMADDWHGYPFRNLQPDHLLGQYQCPFAGCKIPIFKRKMGLLNHMTSGYHWGTDYVCITCGKRFDVDKNAPVIQGVVYPLKDFTRDGLTPSFKKNPPLVRLLTHMETSQSCGVKKSERYGHIVHILTGGFLGVDRDEENRRFFVEVEEPTTDVMGCRDEFEHPEYGDQW